MATIEKEEGSGKLMFKKQFVHLAPLYGINDLTCDVDPDEIQKAVTWEIFKLSDLLGKFLSCVPWLHIGANFQSFSLVLIFLTIPLFELSQNSLYGAQSEPYVLYRYYGYYSVIPVIIP